MHRIVAGRPPRFGSDARTCENGASQVGDALSWRKFDWPGQDDPRSIPQGYLANDAVVIHGGANPVVGHLADFGDQVRRFRHFDAGQGDGGQVVQIIDGAAWGVMTEDGGAGHQWFIAPACRIAGAGLQRFKSWLFFGADVVSGAWREQVVWLAMARSPAGCPVHFSQSYTRYRRETLTVPLLILSGTRQDRIEKPSTASSQSISAVAPSARPTIWSASISAMVLASIAGSDGRRWAERCRQASSSRRDGCGLPDAVLRSPIRRRPSRTG